MQVLHPEERRRFAQSVECPVCHQRTGEPCVFMRYPFTGLVAPNDHPERYRLAETEQVRGS